MNKVYYLEADLKNNKGLLLDYFMVRKMIN